MEALKNMLLQVDDEYLTGLSNKGTVKRAYKDLDQEDPVVAWLETEAEVTLKEVVCRIRMPLGESACTCPSRSICRHIITSILCLKKNQPESEKAEKTGEAEKIEKAEKAKPETIGKSIANKKTESKEIKKSAEAKESTDTKEINPSGDTEETPEALTGKEALKQALEQELIEYPIQKLKRACGSKRYGALLDYLQAGEQPRFQESTVITVSVPWEEAVVKLLSPLEYSTCTCKSRELCPHKAQAILLFQFHRKAVTLEQLRRLTENNEEWDRQELARASASIKEGIRLHLTTGLSRLSPEAAESMERLAVISHGAGLAAFETNLRKIASEYRLYFERSAAFRTEELLEQLLTLYQMAESLENTKAPEKLRALAGSFRDTYHPVPRLHLTAMGSRSFHSKTGYEGEIYYFLEPEKGSFYTWTDARPIFYEGVRRRPLGGEERAQAPWGLNCSREQMMDLEFYLTHAKAAGGGRLSVSQETKSEIVGIRDFGSDAIRGAVFWDYEKLLIDYFGASLKETEGERPVLAGAFHCQEGTFDTVKQRFSMEISDRKGRKITVAVSYSKEEKLTIQVLERLSERLKKEADQTLIFFGIPYLEQGKLCLYPIEVFGRERFFRGREELEEYFQKAEESEANSGKAVSLEAKLQETKDTKEDTEKYSTPETDRVQNMKQASGSSGPDRQILQGMERFLGEIREALGDLFQSGLNSIQDETLDNLGRLARESGTLGLHQAEEELSFLEKTLGNKRHQIEFDEEPVLGAWARLMAYGKLCMEKVSLDRALWEMNDCENDIA